VSGIARRCIVPLCLGLAMLGSLAPRAGAQLTGTNGAQQLPSPAVFGGARSSQPGGNSVTLTLSGGGGYDTNVVYDNAGLGGGSGADGPVLGSTSQTSSAFGGGGATLAWNSTRQRVSTFGMASANYRTFFDIDDYDVQSYDFGGGLSAQLTRRATISLAANAGVQPYYQLGVLGNGLAGGRPRPPLEGGSTFAPDFQAAREEVLRFGGYASYAYQLGRLTTFSADVSRYGFRPLNGTSEQSGFANLGSTFVGARLTRQLRQGLAARVGYGYTWFDSVINRTLPTGEVIAETAGMHNIDVGLDYSKALSVSRRTSLSFGTGTTAWRRSIAANDLQANGETQFNVNGYATLNRQFLRTWISSLTYTRGTSYLEGYNELVVFDQASVSIGGLFTDRLDFGAGVTYTNGGIQTGLGGRAENIGAGAQLRYGFTPSIAAFVSYAYTRAIVPPYMRPVDLLTTYRPDRQGVRVGVTVWVDLLH
jgi:hypothetical protein